MNQNDKSSFLFSANSVKEMIFFFVLFCFVFVCLSFENSYTLVAHLVVGTSTLFFSYS